MEEPSENWSPPPELLRPAPRRTRLTKRGLSLALASIGLTVLAIGIAGRAEVESLGWNKQQDALERDGQLSRGVILNVWQDRKPVVEYRFGADGHDYQARATAPPDVCRRFHPGGPILIRYVPSDPTVNHPLAWDLDAVALGPALTGASALLALAVILFASLKRQSALLASGVPAAALVTTARSSRGGMSVKYRFISGDGGAWSGSGTLKERPGVGQVICVIYSPSRPKRNQPYPLPSVRIR